MHRIYHDFNKLLPGKDEKSRSAPLVCRGTKNDLDALGLTLADGMEVLLYQPDGEAPDGNSDSLEVRATIRYSPQEACFVADFIWDDLMYHSEAEALGRH
ncbi:hypothetical protein [Prosthecobacter sp.]|uniref:hypothetical protein n=1 Tax=Prosthecobacter sp. TaxID=1965333 RepID=UPI003783D22F